MRKKILVVDDEQDVLRAIKSKLERSVEFDIETAEDGDEALEKARKTIPDLIILDLIMPKVSGEKVIQALRKEQKTSDVPIIVSSAKRETQSIFDLMKMGATDYMMKPYDIDKLASLVRKILF